MCCGIWHDHALVQEVFFPSSRFDYELDVFEGHVQDFVMSFMTRTYPGRPTKIPTQLNTCYMVVMAELSQGGKNSSRQKIHCIPPTR